MLCVVTCNCGALGQGGEDCSVAMGTETAVAPTLTVKVVFANLQFIISYFSHSLPFLLSYVISLLSLKIYLYASSISHSYHPLL